MKPIDGADGNQHEINDEMIALSNPDDQSQEWSLIWGIRIIRLNFRSKW
jgi:hypothetical protein